MNLISKINLINIMGVISKITCNQYHKYDTNGNEFNQYYGCNINDNKCNINKNECNINDNECNINDNKYNINDNECNINVKKKNISIISKIPMVKRNQRQ